MLKRIIKPIVPPIFISLAKSMRPAAPIIPTSGIREVECQGLKWRLDMSSIIARSMVGKGVWEEDTTRVITDSVMTGMKVLSVGANFGYYACLMAKLVGHAGHVWAFEPTRIFREQLEWHVKANGFEDRMTIVPYGLSDAPASVSINVTPQSASMHYWPGYNTTGTELIELKTLDSVASGLGIDYIDFISMDIDGHEAKFLRGANASLRRSHPPIAMEFSQRCLHHAGSDVRQVAGLLRDMGYDICRESTRKPFPTEMEFLTVCGNFNSDSNALALPKV
jgi:FkbM family methyltransferase